jgi:uncharacterized protein (TIGR03790 family)
MGTPFLTMRRLVLLLLLLPGSLSPRAHGPEHVLVVANANSRDSLAIAHHYVARRGISPAQLVTLECPTDETIHREVFDHQIHWPLLRHIRRNGLTDQIRFIVTTKGVPLRIDDLGEGGEMARSASVDSELTLLRWELTQPRNLPPLEGTLRNPYFNADPDLSGDASFDPRRWPIYLVTRLTGFTLEDTRALIARADRPRAPGIFAVDLRNAPTLPGSDEVLRRAAARLEAMGREVNLESTEAVLSGVSGLSGYASWGSNDPSRTTRHLDLGFLPGGIACTLVSTSARTFEPPPADWDLGVWGDHSTYYANTPQSLVGDLIRQGAAGASGNVWEPQLAGTAQPAIALSAYAAGYNLAEAFHMAMPALSWQGVVVGDPLCRLAIPGNQNPMRD